MQVTIEEWARVQISRMLRARSLEYLNQAQCVFEEGSPEQKHLLNLTRQFDELATEFFEATDCKLTV